MGLAGKRVPYLAVLLARVFFMCVLLGRGSCTWFFFIVLSLLHLFWCVYNNNNHNNNSNNNNNNANTKINTNANTIIISGSA